MTNAVAVAIGGMQTASASAAEAADTIARATARAATKAPAPSASDEETPAFVIDKAKEPEDDLLQGVETLNRMQQDLVEALGWVPPGSDITPPKTANG